MREGKKKRNSLSEMQIHWTSVEAACGTKRRLVEDRKSETMEIKNGWMDGFFFYLFTNRPERHHQQNRGLLTDGGAQRSAASSSSSYPPSGTHQLLFLGSLTRQ